MARIYYFTFHQNTSVPSVGTYFTVDDVQEPDLISIETSGFADSCIIQFEAQIHPDGEWKPVAGLRADDFMLSTSTIRLNEFWLFDINYFYRFRINITSVTNGSITVQGKISRS